MRVTKRQLRKIIKEDIATIREEWDEAWGPPPPPEAAANQAAPLLGSAIDFIVGLLGGDGLTPQERAKAEEIASDAQSSLEGGGTRYGESITRSRLSQIIKEEMAKKASRNKRKR